MKRPALVATILIFSFIFSFILSAQEPGWWQNAHRDDEFYMYERGSAANAATEQNAILEATLAAKNMLMQRIGIVPALTAAGINATAEYAIVNFETTVNATEKKGKVWNAWVLVRYPQKEKTILLDRWNASIASLQQLRKDEKKIPIQFGLSIRTNGMKTQFRQGEAIIFTVTAEKDCYLVLLDHMSDGSTVVLFPNRFHPDSFVKKGQEVRIPSPDNPTFNLIVTPPYGDERIEAIAATKKTSLHATFSALAQELAISQDVAVMSRGIAVQGIGAAIDATPGTDVQWSRADIVISSFAK